MIGNITYSSCKHILISSGKGAPLIAQAFQVELEKRQKSGDVLFELTGAFCQSQCADGVIVRVNGETYKRK